MWSLMACRAGSSAGIASERIPFCRGRLAGRRVFSAFLPPVSPVFRAVRGKTVRDKPGFWRRRARIAGSPLPGSGKKEPVSASDPRRRVFQDLQWRGHAGTGLAVPVLSRGLQRLRLQRQATKGERLSANRGAGLSGRPEKAACSFPFRGAPLPETA